MTSAVAILLAAFFALGLMRIPIGIAMLTSGLIYLLYTRQDPGLAADQVMNGLLQSDVLLAVPMFILVGNLISAGSIAPRLLELAERAVGQVRGGLGYVSIIVNVVFASMSGSAVADAAGPGAVLVRMMRQSGYPGGFAATLVAAGSTLAPVIPPSIPFILYAVIANVSVGALFVGGVIPGLVMALALAVAVWWQAWRRSLPKAERSGARSAPATILRALLPLGLPVVILGGIRTGAFTPTEGSAVAALYALFLVAVVYRDLGWADIYKVFRLSLVQSAAVMLVIMGAFLVNYAIAAEQVPLSLAEWFVDRQFSRDAFLASVMVLFLVMGCFLDTTIMLLVLVPVLLPTARSLGVDLIHFGLVITVNMMIGMLTPPYGVLLFVISSVTGVPIREVVRESWFFCGVLLACLVLFVFFPEITLYLPRQGGFIR